jgi:hypothetical protein
MVEVVISLVLEVLVKKIASPNISKLLVIPTYGYDKNNHRISPNMASAANDSGTLLLCALVPPSGIDAQRYKDGSPIFFPGRNRPLAAAATGKHRHDVSTMRRAFT